MARSANLPVLVYTLATTQKGTAASCVYMVVHRRTTHSMVFACGDDMQQELILFKHKKWWVVELVLSELTVTEIGGVRRHGARELTVTKTARRMRLQ